MQAAPSDDTTNRSESTTDEAQDGANEKLLSVDSLSVSFDVPGGTIDALRDVSLEIQKGETLGIAGESGSGKSTLALAIVRYLDSNGKVTEGSIEFKGRDLLEISNDELRTIRGGEIAHVAQNAARALNPSMTIGAQIKETVKLHQDVASDSEALEHTHDVLKQVNIPDPADMAERYPHELSGGQQQRALIAMGLSCNPELLILDEPTTGLDVTTQAKFLDLVQELKEEYDVGILLITHNLGVISEIADRVNILYAGEMVEKGLVQTVFDQPANPYTQALLATTPELGTRKNLKAIPGQIPELSDIPDGCIFADRCAFAAEECREGNIPMESVSDGHQSRCLRTDAALENPIRAEESERFAADPGEAILEAEHVEKYYDEGTFFQDLFTDHRPVRAVDDVSLSIRESETVGLVGESGCGKSTFGRTMLGLHDATGGEIKYRGKNLEDLQKGEKEEFHSECQIIFQDPEASLNPSKRIRTIIERPLEKFTNMDKASRLDRVKELLTEVNLGRDVLEKRPHELSGGQQQRVAIARAFATNPSLVVLDEPVSSLDVSVQASILNLLNKLRREYGTSYLLISHDLSVIEAVCDRVAVMYLGKIVESGPVADIFQPPHHPYTRALLSSIPSLKPDVEIDRIRLEGDVPSAREPPTGCSFHTRCPQKIGDICEQEEPGLEEFDGKDGHCTSCHLDREEMATPSRET